MDKKQLKNFAIAYAKEQLGEDQFKSNKNAVKAISEDFIAGFEKAEKCLEHKVKVYDELDKEVSKFYDADNEENEDCGGLISIGEICAQKLGYL
jgi:hypothetical protein